MLFSSTSRLSILLLSILISACGGGESSSTPKSVNKTKINSAPIANNDSATAKVNETVVIDVLGNDSDSDVGDSLNISNITTPAFGQVINNSDTLSYVPNENFIGKDTFSYTVIDNSGASDSAVVEVTMTNVAPTATNDIVETQQSMAININVLANDTSQAQHQLNIVSTSLPDHGVVSLDNNILTYSPALGFVGNDSFVYIVRDSIGDESTATVAITINNIVPIAFDDNIVTTQNNAIEIEPLNNDTDAAGDSFSISGISNVENGTASIENNIIFYTPENGFAGIESFSYSIVDSYGATSQALITIDVSNSDPIANDDFKQVFKNKAVVIDVLANDQDVIGDEITLQSVSQPVNGDATIVDGKITYQPHVDFVGVEVFGYTLHDSYDASASGFIEVNVSNGINIQGKLIGFSQANIKVTLAVANTDYIGVTDDNGMFNITIDSEISSGLVIAHTENITEQYSMHAYLDEVSSYLAKMDESFTIDEQNLSNITTAEYALVNYVQAQENTNVPAATKSELNAARYLVDTDILLALSASINIINADNTIDLPEAYNSINEFIQQPFATQEQLSTWRENSPSEYYAVYDNLFNNPDLVSAPVGLNNVNNILLYSSTNSRVYYDERMILNTDQTGSIHRMNNEALLTWNQNDEEIAITFDHPSAMEIDAFYCGQNASETDRFTANSLVIKQLYSTAVYDVYIRKASGEFGNVNCFDNNIHQIQYDTRIKAMVQPLTISHGTYHFQGLRNSLAESDSTYDQISAAYDLQGDGTFIETIDSVLTPRTGVWQVVNGKLTLDYSDGIRVIYEKNATYKDYDIASYSILAADKVVFSGVTFIIPEQEINWQNSSGYLLYSNLPLNNNALDSSFGLKFNTDFTGVQQNKNLGEWTDSWTGSYSWSLSDNRYKFDYYLNTDTNDYMAFCDVSEDSCQQWRRREMVIIGQVDDSYLVKVYQELNFPESWGTSPTRSGYIALFKFSDL